MSAQNVHYDMTAVAKSEHKSVQLIFLVADENLAQILQLCPMSAY